MTTLIVARDMATARRVAELRGWPRSTWRFVRDGSDIRRAPHADLWLDRSWSDHSRADSIADAVQARLNPTPGWFGYPKWGRGTGTLEESKEGVHHARRVA